MNSSKFLLVVALSLALLAMSCDKKPLPVEATPVVPAWSSGTADFTRYVAIGNSLTAGFQSNALSGRDQAYSYPNLLAKAFRTPSFVQPLMIEPGVGNRQRLDSLNLAKSAFYFTYQPNVFPANFAPYVTTPPVTAYDNLGIPGAVLGDIINTTDFAGQLTGTRQNPFFLLVLRSSAIGRNILAQARSRNPTFMTCWIGNNDVLGYATSGGVSPSTPTAAATFDALYRQLMDSLKSITPNVVVANIPDVTTIPYFTTVPWNGLALTRQGQVDTLNNAYRALGITFTLGANGWVAAVPGSAIPKKLTSSEFVCLTIPQDSLRLAGWGSAKPIPNQYVLTTTEVAAAQAAVNNFNASIDSLSRNRGFAMVNMNAVLKDLAARGRSVPGYGTFTTSYITGGAFSYDGVHPSSRGAVLMANEFIKVINAKYNATIPAIDYGSAPQQQGIGKVASPDNISGGNFDRSTFYFDLLRNIGK
jgi:hypothetical protein